MPDATSVELALDVNEYLNEGSDRIDFAFTINARGFSTSASHEKVVVAVIDTSGSMGEQGGAKMKAAADACVALVQMLPREARFAVVGFSDTATGVVSLCEATDSNKRNAVGAIRRLTPGGTTAMSAGLALAIQESLKRPEADPTCIFLTDGANDPGDNPKLEQVLVFFLLIGAGVAQHRLALKTVCEDAAPSIIAAQHIRAALADLDANAANELLSAPGQKTQARQDYDKRRKEIGDNIVAASENITYGDAERKPLQDIERWLGVYEEDVTRARVMHETGNAAAMLAAYEHATDTMHNVLLPAAQALDKANHDVLESTYATQGYRHLLALGAVSLGGFLLGWPLLRVQGFLSQRTRRSFNQGLLGASLLSGIVFLWALQTFFSAQHELYVAKEQAFDSVHFLWRARAIANDANGSESRWLLAMENKDLQAAARYEKEFADRSHEIADISPFERIHQVGPDAQAGRATSGFSGLLADELKNITFPHERDAAVRAVDTYAVYYGVDQQIRQLEAHGMHRQAVELCTGNNPGQSNYAFGQFDNALEDTLKINQNAFEEAHIEGMQQLKPFNWEVGALLLGVVIAAVFGLRPRLREYYV